MDRALNLDQLPEPFDVAIIGGGATGLGAAVEAASRGYRTVLLEARDFAQGTSSRSTKLVHGGVRYLAQGNVGLVREALLERFQGELEDRAGVSAEDCVAVLRLVKGQIDLSLSSLLRESSG